MREGTRSKSPNKTATLDDLFWKNLPDHKLKLKMKKVVCDYLDELKDKGQILSEIKEKKSHHDRIADLL